MITNLLLQTSPHKMEPEKFSHLKGGGTQACLTSSSDPSPQSSLPSQIYALKIQRELLHL